MPEPGEHVDGKYRLVRTVGKGGMGVVYEAVHTRLGHRVALKFLLPDAASSAEAVARFEREARASCKLSSPHVARVIDIGQTSNGLPFLVMEFLEGQDLASLLRRRIKVAPYEAVDLVMQACAGIAEAHSAGIVHRDIKPSNLFLANQPTGVPTLKVMDFGISKVVTPNGEELTATNVALGTLNYMAPEQMVDPKATDRRADVWSLGVVLYKLLSGVLPFVGETGPQMAVAIATKAPTPITTSAPGIDEELARVVMKALKHAAADRYQTMTEFGEALAPWGSGTMSLASLRIAIAGTFERDHDPHTEPTRLEPTPASAPASLGSRSNTGAAEGLGEAKAAATAGDGATNATWSAMSVREPRSPRPRSARAGIAIGVGAVLAIASVGVAVTQLGSKPSVERAAPAGPAAMPVAPSEPKPEATIAPAAPTSTPTLVATAAPALSATAPTLEKPTRRDRAALPAEPPRPKPTAPASKASSTPPATPATPPAKDPWIL